MPSVQIRHIPDALSHFLIQLLLADVIHSIARDIPFAHCIDSHGTISLRKIELVIKGSAFGSPQDSPALYRGDMCRGTTGE